MNLTSFKKDLPKFGIALSGGGARGIAHIGVLEALEKYGIKPQVVSGTSMGAIVGVFYAAGYPPKDLLKVLKDRKFHHLVNWHKPFSGLIDMDKAEEIYEVGYKETEKRLRKLFNDIDLEKVLELMKENKKNE